MAQAALSDAEEMFRLGEGDVDALGRLVRRHQEKVLALAYRLQESWNQAEEIAQEVFLRMRGAAQRSVPEVEFTTWLYRIVVNLCFDRERRKRRYRASKKGGAGSSGDRNAESDTEVDSRSEIIRQAAGGLPVRQRTMLVLHRYHNLSRRQIAYVTCCSISAVESLLVRAYANLRKSPALLEGDGN